MYLPMLQSEQNSPGGRIRHHKSRKQEDISTLVEGLSFGVVGLGF